MSVRTIARGGYARESTDGGRIAGVHFPNAGAANIAFGSLPGNTPGWITTAPTTGAFKAGRDTCSRACWHCSSIIREGGVLR